MADWTSQGTRWCRWQVKRHDCLQHRVSGYIGQPDTPLRPLWRFLTVKQGYGTALGLITYLHETGKLNRAYYTQSTPYHQGSRSAGWNLWSLPCSPCFRLTALELQTLKIPSSMLCDSMVGSLFQHHDIHAVGKSFLLSNFSFTSDLTSNLVVGADRIARNGDTANKASFASLNVTLGFSFIHLLLGRNIQRSRPGG